MLFSNFFRRLGLGAQRSTRDRKPAAVRRQRSVRLELEQLETRCLLSNSPLAIPVPSDASYFGYSVAVWGSYVVVGAIGTNSFAGAAYLYNTSGTLLQTFSDPNGTRGDDFGVSVALSGSNVLVGAYGTTIGTNSAEGAAYLFSLYGTLLQTFSDPNGATNDDFGVSVALSGSNVLVGANGTTIGANSAEGAAYLYSTSGTLLQTFPDPNGATNDGFGSSVALSGSNVLVGAAGTTIGANSAAGAAYLYNTSGTLLQTFPDPNGAPYDHFGASAALSGSNVLVGAYGTTIGTNSFAGAAYLYNTSGTLLHTFPDPNDATNDDFGASVALSGSNVLVGAYGTTIGTNSFAGAAYLYSTSGTLLQTFPDPNGVPFDFFGVSVALSGTNVLVGAEGVNGFQGEAYLYDTPATLEPVAGNNQSTVVGSAFGNLLEVQASGADGNPAAGVVVTFSVSGGPNGAIGTFTGATTVTTNAQGIAIGPALTANDTAGSFTVTAEVGGAPGYPSADFALTNFPGPAHKLAVANAPVSVSPGQNFNFQVDVEDQDGNLVTGDDSEVTATLTGPGPFTGGSTTVQAIGGVASFIGMAIQKPGTYTLAVADNSLLTAAVDLAVAVEPVLKEFPTPTTGSGPEGITTGPDGNLWFTEYQTNQIGEINPHTGVISEFTIPTANSLPTAIVAAAGNLWFTEAHANQIGEINPTTHHFTEFPISTTSHSAPAGITLGPDGNLWFTENSGNKIGELNLTSDTISDFAIPTSASSPDGITTGPDGNLWFTEVLGNKIGEFNPVTPDTQAIQEFSLNTPTSYPAEITAGPYGRLWFTEQGSNRIGFITTGGTILDFPVPTAGSNPSGIAVGADGNLWFTEEVGQQIGRINPATYAITEFPTPTAASVPFQIAAGPDGNLWFTESAANQIGEVDLNPSAASGGSGSQSGPASQLAFANGPTSVVAGQNFHFQVDAEDGSGNLASSDFSQVTVTLSGPDVFADGSKTETVQAIDGVASFSGLAITTAGSYTLAVADGSLTAPSAAALNIRAGKAVYLVVSPSTASATVGTAFNGPLTAEALDSFDNPVANVLVTFSETNGAGGAGGTFSSSTPVATSSQGLASASTLTANNTVGSFTVAAAAGFLNASFLLTNLAGAPANLVAQTGTTQSVVVGTAYAPLQILVTDGSGNPVSGASVTFTAVAGDNGASGAFGGNATVPTNTQGIATAPTLTAGHTAGSYTVTASVSGGSPSASFSLTNLAAAASQVFVQGSATQTVKAGKAFAPLTVRVVDLYGNAASATVTFTVTPTAKGAKATFPGGLLMATAATSTVNGLAEAVAPTLTSNTKLGSYTVVTSVPGGTVSATFTLTNQADPVVGPAQSATVKTTYAKHFFAHVTDAFGNPIAGVPVTFTAPANGASGTFGGKLTATAISNSAGMAMAPAFRANTKAGSFAVTVVVQGVAAPETIQLTNLAGPPAHVLTVSGTGQSAAIDSGFAVPLAVEITDAFGNVLSAVPVRFIMEPGSGRASATFTGSTAVTETTTNTGVAAAPLLQANGIRGAFKVLARVAENGVILAATFELTNL